MATQSDQGVHPFTLAWWETLPTIYRRADRGQGFRITEAWAGLNRDPRFITGHDGWYRTNLSTLPYVSHLGLSRTFRATPNRPVTIRTWHSPTNTGTGVVVRHVVRNHTGEVVADTNRTFTTTTIRHTHSTTVTPDRFGVLQVSVQIEIDVPDARDLLDAIHVGLTDVAFGDLPGVEYFSEAAAYPLLRYMDGIGHQAGFLSDMVNDMHEGRYTDPLTAPESALPFLAAVLGVPRSYSRTLTLPQLREHLVDLVEGDYPTPGSQEYIATTARQYITGSKEVTVVPAHTIDGYSGPDPLHTLVVSARADEVPGGSLPAFAQFLNDAGVIPAGHRVIAREATQSWDQWTAAVGATWDSLSQTVYTWNDSDSAGVQLIS